MRYHASKYSTIVSVRLIHPFSVTGALGRFVPRGPWALAADKIFNLLQRFIVWDVVVADVDVGPNQALFQRVVHFCSQVALIAPSGAKFLAPGLFASGAGTYSYIAADDWYQPVDSSKVD